MSLAPQNTSPDVIDAIDGSITTWYENVNNCLKSSECIPGHYEYSQSPGYGNQCPIQEGGNIKIDIRCERFEIVDLNNSYVDAEFTAPITIPAQKHDGEAPISDVAIVTYYVGWKSVYDLMDHYTVYSNGDFVCAQHHPHYESFINYISLTDSAKENSPCYATSNKLINMNPNVPGVYISLPPDTDEDVNYTVTIRTKIPLNMFPILQHLKYFPGFMGRLTIDISPSYKNLIYVNITGGAYREEARKVCISSRTIGRLGNSHNHVSTPTQHINPEEVRSGVCFNQINCSSLTRAFREVTEHEAIEADEQNGIEAQDAWTEYEYMFDVQTFRCNHSTLTKFHLYQAVYMVKMDVYNLLEAAYLQYPLLFPIQTVSNTKFTYPMGTQQHFTLQNTATLSHCDTIFVVFPANSNERTVSYNPEIKAHLHINSTFYPKEVLSTARNDPRFYNLQLDALNINNNPLMTPSDDVVGSLNPYRKLFHLDAEDNAVNEINSMVPHDRSNFFFGVPLSTDEDFMGGISSNGSTVQIELIGDRDSDNEPLNQTSLNEAPVAIFLEDKLLKIYSMKPSGHSQIQVTNATLDQVAASGGRA